MPKNCVVCKTNPAELFAKIQNRETGEFSAPVPLCKDCCAKITKTRQIEIVSDIIEKSTDSTTAHTDADAAQKIEERLPLYQNNVKKLVSLFDSLFSFTITVFIIGIIAFVALLVTGASEVLRWFSLYLIISCIPAAIALHILHLAAEAIDDYLDKHK